MLPAKKAMLCWTPGTDKVAVVEWPDVRERCREYANSALACYSWFQAADVRAHLFIEAVHLIVRDGCDPRAVHRALLGIQEYVDACSFDMPEFPKSELERLR